MMVRWMSNPLYVVSDWFVKLAYANFLWVIFTLAGGIVLGIFPSTVALYTILRKLVRGDTLNEIFALYATTYKQEFLKANKFGIFFWTGGSLIALNTWLLPQFEGTMLIAMMSGLIFTMFLFSITLAFFFPAYVTMPEMPFAKIFLVAVFLPFSHLKTAAVSLLGFTALLAAFYFFPILLSFWGVSAFAVLFMYVVQKRLETKNSAVLTNQEAFSS
ncbi:YesL family protein [Alkalicoccus daliensis]|uniref:Uncharacterized membrane protein YesL n=1 Tax=Alkalicoccus daliensis TaxID=745820 RepID=A0A1H0HX48_9BACI|nr:DUF624 domain-containing protein [Alkalicoccus daliensis]SDO23391.1 Uncharacterized membrane protein YesL [Alkalicoccus daliensis]